MSMTFQFDNFAQLIFMDGHGVFVWSSVLLTSFLLLSLVLNPILKSAGGRRLKKYVLPWPSSIHDFSSIIINVHGI